MILMILAPLIGVIGAALFSYGAWLVAMEKAEQEREDNQQGTQS
ncbi:hypothetical protein [Citrobacter youngae]|nr:hypothetical protein [Citrobacter youngae]MEB1028558.1 hypothetical protein [Citrobacter youngae]